MSLRARVFLRTTGLFTALIVVICIVHVVFMTGFQRDLERERGRVLALSLAQSVVEYIEADDEGGLKMLLERTLEQESALEYALVRRSGSPPVHTFEGGVPEHVQELRHGTVNGAAVSEILQQQSPSGVLYDVAARVGQTGAVLRLGISSRGIDQEVQSSVLAIAALGAAILAVVSLLVAWFSKGVTREVERLTAMLRSDRERFRSLVETTSDLIWEVDRDLVLTYVSPTLKDLLGYTREEVLGRKPWDFLPPEETERILPLVKEVVGKRMPIELLEVTHLHRDGRRIVLEISGKSACDETGEHIGYRGVGRDITVRKKAEDALGKERYLLSALMDNLPHNIYFKDAESRFIRINKALADNFGLTDASEVLGRTDFDFFTEEHARQAMNDEKEILRTGRPMIDREEKETWRDGRTTWAVSTKMPLYDDRKRIVGTFGVSRDITGQKLAAEALRVSEMKYRTLFDSSRDAIMTLTPQEGFLSGNPAAIRLFGCSDESEFVSCHPADLSPEKQPDGAPSAAKAQQMMSIAMEEGSHFFEWKHRRLDGEEFFATVLLTRMELEGEELLQATVRDVSDQKQAAEALRAAKEAAEAASQAKSDFLANVSHEIRSPMNAILGLTELVLDTELTSAQRDHLMSVHESAESMLLVINDILDFSKIEAGKLDLHPEPFELRGSLGDAMKSLALRAHAKDLELAWRVDPGIPDFVVGDFGRLRQILVNLVGNAIKFTDEGEVLLEVGCEELSADHVELRFSVRDTGIGIPEEKLGRIFDAFEQVDTSMSRRFGGSGLGLAICSRLVERMNGRIWVESEEGEGSTFHFTARLRVRPDKSASSLAGGANVLRGTRILVVDDNPTNRFILEEMLRSWEMEPTCVARADKALRLLHEAARDGDPFRVVLVDAGIPGIDGFTLAERILEWDEPGTSVILMLTAGRHAEDVIRCERLQVAGYLLKPVKQSELFEVLLRVSRVLSAEDRAGSTAPVQRPLHTGPLRILLAEDSIVNQKLAVALLEKYGHSVLVAHNGHEVLELLESESVDLILMDLQMPDMDGLEATCCIRAGEKERGGHIPIIAMTAHALKGDRERCLQAGMDGYVSKPIQVDQLLRALESVPRA